MPGQHIAVKQVPAVAGLDPRTDFRARHQQALAVERFDRFAARLNVATPKAGAGFELEVIAAFFIGGAATTGGVGKVVGAVIGAFIIGVMNNGMSIMGIGIDWQQVIKGVVLMLAVFLDVYYKNKG